MSIIGQIEEQLQQEGDLTSQQWSTPRDVQRYLTKNGYRKIGSGKFADAYVKGGENKVVRVSSKEDYCWYHFMEWLGQQRSNRFLPKVYSTKDYEWERNGKMEKFAITFVERLKKLTPTAVMQTQDLAALAELYTMGMLTHQLAAAIERRFRKEGVEKDEIQQWMDDHHLNEFTYTTNALDQLADDTECFFDFHYENLMYRSGDKSIVIIDPLADMANTD